MPKKRIKQDMKVSGLKRNRVVGIPTIKHGIPQPGITKKKFMDVLAKAVPPIPQLREEKEGQNDK